LFQQALKIHGQRLPLRMTKAWRKSAMSTVVPPIAPARVPPASDMASSKVVGAVTG
jgi:AmiR/NasT family two-component response regulator